MHHTVRSLSFATSLLLGACGGGGAATAEESTIPPPADEAGAGAEAAVTPIPDGYHSINPMLVVPDVEAAIAFYEAALGAEQAELVRGPDGAPMHGEVRIGDSIVMLSPEHEEHGSFAPSTAGGTNGALLIYVADVDAAFARALEAGAESVMPVSDMFWGDRYGQIQDPYGHRWSLATHRYELSGEEMGRRAQAWSEAVAAGEEPPTFEPGEAAESHQPEGWHTVNSSLVVGGPEAIDFFVQALGAEEVSRMVTPDGHLVHAELRVGDSILMLSGAEPEREPHMKTPARMEGRAPLALYLYVDDADAAFARATAAGATEELPVTDTFWGDRFGQVRTPDAHAIGLATHVEDLTPEEMVERMRAHADAHPPAE